MSSVVAICGSYPNVDSMCGSFTYFFSIKLHSAQFSLENCSLMLSNYQDKCIKFHKSRNGFAVFGEKLCAYTQYIGPEKEIHV